MPGQFQLLKTKRFLPLFLTQALGAFNDNAFKAGIIVLIAYSANNNVDTMLVPLASSMLIIPMIIFSPLAGSIADKFDKSKVTRILKMTELVLMLLAVFGLLSGGVYYLMSVLFLAGVQSTFFGPIKYGALPKLLEKQELIGANALIEMSTFLAILLGMLIGSVVPTYSYGYQWLSLILVIVAMCGLGTSMYVPKLVGEPTIKLNFNIFTGLYDSFKNVYADKYSFLCIIAISWFWLLGAVFLAVLPNYTRIHLLADPKVYSILISVFACGIAIGSLLCNKILKGSVDATFVPLSGLLMSICFLDVYFNAPIAITGDLMILKEFLHLSSNWHFIIDVFLISCCGGIYIVPLYAIIQDRAPTSHKARIIAGNNVFNAIFMTVGMLSLSLALYFHVTIPKIFLVVALINFYVVFKLCRLLPGALIRSIVRGILNFLFKVEITGQENLKNAGDRVVITPNHTSFVDGVLMAAYFPGDVLFAVYSVYMDKWWVKPIKYFINAYPLDSTNPFSLRGLIKEVKKQGSCIIFPEGRISVTGGLMKIYEGPGVVADKANAKILPVRIDGAQYSIFSRMRHKVKIQLFPKVTITILPHTEIDADIDSNIKGRARRRLLGQKLYKIMTTTFYESQKVDEHLYQALLDARNIHGGDTVTLDDISGQSLTYNKLIFRSLIVAEYIKTWARNDATIGVFLPNTSAIAVVFFGVQAANKVAALLNYSLGAVNIISCVKAAKVNKIITARIFIEKGRLEKIVTSLEDTGCELLYLEDLKAQSLLKEKIVGLLQHIKYKTFSNLPVQYNTNNAAVVLFTSGSEGAPKAVILSAKNLLSNHKQMAAVIDFNPSDKILNAMPVFHAFGLNIGFLLPIMSGMPVFMYPSPLHYRIIPEVIYDLNITIFFGTNTFLSGYARYAHAYDFYSIRYVFAGAERLNEETNKVWMEKFGVRIFEGYGATEASPVISSNTPMHYKSGSVGQIMPGIQMRLETVDGVNDGGRLFVKGNNIMLGYYYADNPGVLCPPINGWHDTGDIVSIDDEGYITIRGRVKRFAKIAGEMISLAAVEDNFQLFYPNDVHAVINLPDERKGEKLVLITTANLDVGLSRKQLKDAGVSDIHAPREVVNVDKIPLLGTGKIDYARCKDIAE
ncbi:MAG: acyl-[ACP]--phospholipid O-acyltransferase [Francisellaceae bacterium]|jgi:acyl-[acyl-carrier-protein]-phospholipid O-acyltransferase / long-chain-fatty-acid--[acyl-carrier-protein] ligase|nr:acyl-[ACP]--phospholipid O-acyltransferase [Francisellaceae bacterium]MBT6207531.1 acyl-[ACP]--phospholipid O-acyltransferase [Francisellaceae bacterium]